jgi:hypothetical protein
VETQITEIMVTPHEGSSATTGKTDLVYTLRLSPKTIDGTEVRRRRLRLPPCSRPYSRVRGQHERVVSRDAKAEPTAKAWHHVRRTSATLRMCAVHITWQQG